MTLLRFTTDPFDNVLRLQRALTRSLGRPFLGESAPSGRGVFPALNFFEDRDGEAIVVKAEVPGIAPDSLEVETFRDRLTITGERTIPEPDRPYRYPRRERRAGEFRRVFQLPFEVDRNSGRATYEDGILTIRLDKADEAKPRSIKIGT